jgi:hypothetical protein
MATWNLSAFSIAVLQKLNLPTSSNNINTLNAWQLAEGGSGIGSGQAVPTTYNPLNTIQPGFGGSPTPGYSAGIMSYPSFGAGVDATAKALSNGLYGGILNAFKNNAPPSQTASIISSSQWGTHFSYGGTPPSTTTLQGGNIPSGGFPQTPARYGRGYLPTTSGGTPAGAPASALHSTQGSPGGGVVNDVASVPGDIANAALSPIESAVGGYVKEAAIILVGIILVFMGLWLMFHGSGGSGSATAPTTSANTKGARTPETEGAGTEGARAEGAVADAAVLA